MAKTQVLNGPHGATKEQLGGVSVVDLPDMDAALAWATRNPAAGFGVVEVRPLLEPPGGLSERIRERA
jgi:hypothetical protein